MLKLFSQPTKVYPTITKFSAAWAAVFAKLSQGLQAYLKSLA
jgi:hypothetical protein